MILAKRDHMGTDKPVGGEAANKEGPRQQPNIAGSAALARRAESCF
jgi:hypothetical protein